MQTTNNFARIALVTGSIIASTAFSTAVNASFLSFRSLGNGSNVRTELSTRSLDLGCGAKHKDSSCGANKKSKDSTMKKTKDGKCGEGKCGTTKKKGKG